MKMLTLSGFLNPGLHQFRIKSTLFTSRNPDFSVLSRCCVKSTGWSLEKIRQLSDVTHTCSRSPTNVYNYDDIGRRNCVQHSTNRRDDYYVTHFITLDIKLKACRCTTVPVYWSVLSVHV